jgi:hypothetical protein
MLEFGRLAVISEGLMDMIRDLEARSKNRIDRGEIPTFEAGFMLGLTAAHSLIKGLTVDETWSVIDRLNQLWLDYEQEAGRA